MVTRQEMIEKLTELELKILLENPEYLNDVSRFFANCGYHVYLDKALVKIYKDKLGENNG